MIGPRRPVRAVRSLHAYALVDLLTAMAIMGVLTAVAIPALLAVKQSAQRSQCALRMQKLAAAVEHFEDAHLRFPTGVGNPTGPIVNRPTGLHYSWTIELLPYLDQANTHRHIDQQRGVYDAANSAVRRITIEALQCPGQRSRSAVSSYAGVHHDREAAIDADQNGLLFLNSRVTHDDVRDGLACTLLLGEKIVANTDGAGGDLGWMSGTRATLRNTGHPLNAWLGESSAEPAPSVAKAAVGGFGGMHTGGVYFAFADGNVQFINESIAPALLSQLGHRADGAPQETWDNIQPAATLSGAEP